MVMDTKVSLHLNSLCVTLIGIIEDDFPPFIRFQSEDLEYRFVSVLVFGCQRPRDFVGVPARVECKMERRQRRQDH